MNRWTVYEMLKGNRTNVDLMRVSRTELVEGILEYLGRNERMDGKEALRIEIDRAEQELKQAEQNYEYADEDFILPASLEVLAKQKKLDALYSRAKKMWGCA
jgi:hypothetical protein